MLAAIHSALASLLNFPTTDDGNNAASSTLPDREECHDDLELQPYDCPERARWSLLAISNRESPYSWSPSRRWVGQHTANGDSKHSAGLGRWGRRVGRLSWLCPFHWGDAGFSTVGPHGMIYAYNVQRLDVPGNCVPWQVFASPLPSAKAALGRYLKRCEKEPTRRSWCPRLAAVIATRDRFEAKAKRAARRGAKIRA